MKLKWRGNASYVTSSTCWSAVLHLILTLLVLGSLRHEITVRTALPGTSEGHHLELSYLPGGRPASMLPPTSKIAAPRIHRNAVKKQQMPPVKTAEGATSEGLAGRSGNDALGSEDIQIALTTYSPSPKPDLSRLPQGTQGEVVLDITIDPTGKVADLQILHALGFGVEGKVAETVRTWTFRPAMKDGTPVASIQELHFHYGPV